MRKESDAYRFGFIGGYLKGKEDAHSDHSMDDAAGSVPER